MINTFENFQKMYQEKLMTADEAVKSIKSGDTIAYGEFVTVRMRWTLHWQDA